MWTCAGQVAEPGPAVRPEEKPVREVWLGRAPALFCGRVPRHARDGFHVPRAGLPMSHIRAMFGVQVEGQVGV